jgi:hypothetical protein
VNIEDVLHDDEVAILDEARSSVARIERYARDGEEPTRRRVEALYRQVVAAVQTRDLDALLLHTERIARERFDAGFELSALQTAFSALEDAIRRHALARLPAGEQTWGLGLVATALAHAREELWRSFASCGAGAQADLTPLFKWTDPAARHQSAEERVFPV